MRAFDRDGVRLHAALSGPEDGGPLVFANFEVHCGSAVQHIERESSRGPVLQTFLTI